jgi:hypothetical protein
MINMSNRRRLRRPVDPAVRALQAHADHIDGQLDADHEPSAWLRGPLAALGDGLATGRVTRCAHLRRTPGAVAYHALWAPDTLLCAFCAPTTALTGDADRTCDRCGRVAERIHPDLVAAGPQVLVAFGLCRDCQGREVIAEPMASELRSDR